MASEWTALKSVLMRSPKLSYRLSEAFARLDSEMTLRTSMGATRGYIESGVSETRFLQMVTILNEFPGDYDWHFVFIGPPSGRQETFFEYRIRPSTQAAEMAVIGGVSVAKQVAMRDGKEAMKEYLTTLKQYNAVMTLKEEQRAGYGHGCGHGCARCGARL